MAPPDEIPAHRIAADPPVESLRNLLLAELRASVSARLAGGTDPAELTGALERRLGLLRDMRGPTDGRR